MSGDSSLQTPLLSDKRKQEVAEQTPPKRAKVVNSEKWSWPARLDAIAKGMYGDCLGVTDDSGAQLTWKQLAHQSRVVAQELKGMGFTAMPSSGYPNFPGEVVVAPAPVVVMMGHNAKALAVVFGILRRGFPVLPLSILHADKNQLRQRYKEAMDLFKPVAIISDSPMAQELLNHHPGVKIILPEDLFWEDPEKDYDDEDVPTTLDSVLAYMFTSGSTGRSKCVTGTNRMAWAEVQWYPQVYQKLGYKVDPRVDRWKNDHEMGWWGAAFFGEIDVALAMSVCIVMMNPRDSDLAGRGVTLMGALPSQLNTLFPGAKNIPETLRVVFCWAERCDVELGKLWKKAGIKMADLLIASEFFLSLASFNLEAIEGDDGRAAHVMRAVQGTKVFVLDQNLMPLSAEPGAEIVGMLGLSGPQVSPGYAEPDGTGRTVIGSGEQSRDAFKIVNGEWTVVPKDLVRKRPDQSLLSIGRAGGTVKVKGGVLMATNVVEIQLQRDSIAAACITDPVHVEGGSCVVLEINWQNAWSLRDSLQQASFLRMPILYMCDLPRNQSTGKVQKALVQSILDEDHQAERESKEELRQTQVAQLAWYANISLPMLVPCLVQFQTLQELCIAIWTLHPILIISCLLSFTVEIVLRLCLVAWTYSASAHSQNLVHADRRGMRDLCVPLLVFIIASAASKDQWTSVMTSGVLLSIVVGFGVFEEIAKANESNENWRFRKVSEQLKHIGRLGFAVIVGISTRLLSGLLTNVTVYYGIGLLCIFALSRFIPGPPWDVDYLSFLVQKIAGFSWSLFEASGYMLGMPLTFTLALPSLTLSQFPSFAWSRLKRPGRPVAQEQQSWPYAGPRQQLYKVKAGEASNGSLWVDVEETHSYDMEVAEQAAVRAQTVAGEQAQKLARQAGVDFHTMDSLRIARLSVILKKNFRQKSGEDSIEFSDLREACANEQSFVDLIDARLVPLEEEEGADDTCVQQNVATRDGFTSWQEWAQGYKEIHREGPTPAPWDCQVDVLMEWTGPAPIDLKILSEALQDMKLQHPLLRAVPPPDDSTDNTMGNGSCALSTTAAATWALICSVWSKRQAWQWLSLKALRWAVVQSLWRCWPRTLILKHDARCAVEIHMVTADSDGWTSEADQVYKVVFETWESWWNSKSMANLCVVTLNSQNDNCSAKQFLYATTSHKYCDGGSVAAFIQFLGERYEARLHAKPNLEVTPVLTVQQERLWKYLQGVPCPQGSVDAYFQDINHDSFHHDSGFSVGVQLTRGVCDLMRAVGLRMSCSEEVAWLSCMVCALCRLMPEEKVIKLLMVHNGRIGDAEGIIACSNQYVLMTIPCANKRQNTPIADIASRVKYAISNNQFRRPLPCEQAHAKINIGGMLGATGNFSQVFKSQGRAKKGSRSRAPHVLQLRMDNEGGTWCVKDYKLHRLWDPKMFWEATTCAAVEIAEGWFIDPLMVESYSDWSSTQVQSQ